MKGKKTMLLALIVEILGFLEAFGWTEYLGSETAGKVLMVIGLAIGILRVMTNSPIFSSIPGGGNTGSNKSIGGGGNTGSGNKKYRPQESNPKG